MPWEVQLDAIHKIPALRDAKIYRPGYAIEYDYFDPTQLKQSLESKVIEGLFFAGQVNGWTSEQVNSKERQSNKGTSGQVNEWTGYLWRVRDNMRTRFPLCC